MKSSGGIELINVLDEKQFGYKHIPGSYNIPVETEGFTHKVEEEAGSKEKPVVVCCASTGREASEKAAQELEAAGFSNVHDSVGGIKEWGGQGKPFEGGQI